MNNEALCRIPPLDRGCLLRLVLMRHGQPDKEAHGRCYGRLDIGLSPEGRRQLCQKVDFLGSLRPDALYASTSKRALESAEHIGERLNLPVEARPELCEIDFGAFEGLTYTEIEDRYPREFKQWMDRPTEIKFPAGESFAEMKVRLSSFVTFLSEFHRGHTLLVVSHAGVNRLILADALGLASNNIFKIDQAFAAVNVIDYFPGYPLVRLING
jgi:alpha-ribazole phosphatase